MLKKIFVVAAIIPLTGCMVTPKFEMSETINFDYVRQDVTPMSYNDLLCCYDCNA